MAYPDKIKNKLLSISIGITYVVFGFLKFFPNVSPAEQLAENTISLLTFDLIPNQISILLLAFWETTIGIFLILNSSAKIILNLAILHILLTFSPILLFPEQVFDLSAPTFTLLGQYIFKNIIILSCLTVLRLEAKQSSKRSIVKNLNIFKKEPNPVSKNYINKANYSYKSSKSA